MNTGSEQGAQPNNLGFVLFDLFNKCICGDVDSKVDHLVPGRSAELRASTIKELNATTLLALPIETFSIKTRSGPPNDAASDLNAPVWAGVIPMQLVAGTPEDAPNH